MRSLFEARRAQVATAVWALCAAAVVVGWQVDSVQAFMVDSGALQLLILAAVLDLSVVLSRVASPVDAITATAAALADNADFMRAAKEGVGPAAVLALTGVNSLRLLRALADSGRQTRLLLSDPERLSDELRTELRTTVSRIAREPVLRDHVEIRYFADAPQMHGALLPELAAVGWFQSASGITQRGEPLHYPIVLASTRTDEGRRLWTMLDSEISRLWNGSQATR